MFSIFREKNKPHKLQMRKSWLRQRGIVMGQIAALSAVVGSAGVVGFDWAGKQAALDREIAQGFAFKIVNVAAGNYMSRVHDQLVAKKPDGTDVFPPECSTVSYGWGAGVTVPLQIRDGSCQLDAILTRHADGSPDKRYTVKNANQPTLPDLIQMGMLDPDFSVVPLLPVNLAVEYIDPFGSGVSALAPNTYAVVVASKCVGAGITSTCTLENKALKSLVFNIQPFVSSSNSSQNFSTLLSAIGADGAISGPEESMVKDPAAKLNPTGEFRSLGGIWTEPNPVKREKTYTNPAGESINYLRGVDDLAAIRNGYDASTALEYTRRDGSSPPTADWDFNGKNLSKVSNLQLNGQLSGKDGVLTVADSQKVMGDQTVVGNQAIKGNVTVGNVGPDGTVTGIFTALGNMFVNGATELRGALTVAGNALFKGEVTFEKLVKGTDVALTGQLSANTATVAGNLGAGQLHIGNTLISPDGTLLGGPAAWGVQAATACTLPFSLAQDTAGQLMICKVGQWKKLITQEDAVAVAGGTGQACSPDGAPGKLPDGTLAVCQGGVWTSTQLGSSVEGGVCSVRGALGSREVGGQFILMACDGTQWQTKALAKPKPASGVINASCSVNDEIVLESNGGKSLLVCKNNIFVTLDTQLVSGNAVGGACNLPGAVSLDNRTSILVCTNNSWHEQGAFAANRPCAESDNARAQVSPGVALWCVNHLWQDFPDIINAVNSAGDRINLKGGVRIPNGDIYYVYSQADIGSWNTAVDFPWLDEKLCANYNPTPSCTLVGEDLSASLYLDYGYWKPSLQVTLPTVSQLGSVYFLGNNRPQAWQGEFAGDFQEFWTRDRVDGVNGGFYTVDIATGLSSTWRYTNRFIPVVLRIRGWEHLKHNDNLH